jgi:hypothetical protein
MGGREVTREDWIGIGILLALGFVMLSVGASLAAVVSFGGAAFIIWGRA